jgi:hypothetical protein
LNWTEVLFGRRDKLAHFRETKAEGAKLRLDSGGIVRIELVDDREELVSLLVTRVRHLCLQKPNPRAAIA